MRDSWVIDAIGREEVKAAVTEATRHRLGLAFEVHLETRLSDADRRRVYHGLELAVFDALEDEEAGASLRQVSALAFQVARAVPTPR